VRRTADDNSSLPAALDGRRDCLRRPILLGGELRRDVHIHGMVLREPEDHGWPAAVSASASPAAVLGKAMPVATLKHPQGQKP
jgi:hypothetical protein